MIDDGTRLLTIGQLSRSTGLPVRTIRYWSDAGALPPVTRSEGGYRLYDAGSVARLELTFDGLDTADPDIRTRMRFGVPDLPDDPTIEQVDAWVELAELMRDTDFRARMRRAVEFNVPDRGPEWPAGTSLWFMSRLVQLAGEVQERGLAPDAPEAATVLAELLGDADRSAVLERMVSASHVELARFRELLALVRGTEPLPTHREEFAWVVTALRAQLAGAADTGGQPPDPRPERQPVP
ncbi:MerR family DNA-binding transcriptional regulator [Streptomyces sp. NBC_00878]|uniref:MerR family DNA-binding transcriptional regulator n=1 Tax=Streptomyces sp. NBC_00878 TaxID=2975854 RepID=UPI0022544840|nr:MerR family DNA-binding transcriptional regulator [Streptomyces sp. NBC_00878]MCX4905258.1 MerR family DNA-binding transcriptional regulator [Streptomyces sp. NBC_00878]